MGTRTSIEGKVRFRQCRAWNVDGKFYHTIDRAIEELTYHLCSRVRLLTYYRHGDSGLNYRTAREAARMRSGFYSPGGFHDRWLVRARQRVQQVVLNEYNKKLV